jgi:hypothetical protein
MIAHVATIAFLGLEARSVAVQVQIAAGLPKFLVVGLSLLGRSGRALVTRAVRLLLFQRAPGRGGISGRTYS